MIHASRHENQRALVETHQNGFHQFNFKLIPPAPLDWHVWRQSQPPQRARLAVRNAFLPLFRSLAHYISF